MKYTASNTSILNQVNSQYRGTQCFRYNNKINVLLGIC